MNDTEVLIINGSPGSGKSTLANAIAEKLREMELAHAVIDVDELARTYPELSSSFRWKNLSLVWPNYSSLQNLKVILPVLIDTKEDLQALQDATTPCAKFTICELVASDSILKERVTKREPNEYWQNKLRGLVDNYSSRDAQNKFGDFQVRTDNKSIDEAATEALQSLGWVK